MKVCVLTLLSALAVLSSACANPPERPGLPIRRIEMPEWTRTGKHPSYPDDKFLTAFALADSPLAARQKAGMALEEALCRAALEKGATMLRGSRFADVVDGPARWISADDLGDAVRFDFASNGFEAVAVNAIARDELALRARGILEEARRRLAKLDANTGELDLRKRLEAWCARFVAAARVTALMLLADGELDRDALTLAEDAAINLWAMPAVIEAEQEGGEQYARIGGGLPRPLGLKLSFRGRPAPGIPLIWGVNAPGAGVVDSGGETDSRGAARCNVYSLVPNGRQTAVIHAGLDLDRLAGLRLGITPPVWQFTAFLPCRLAGQLLVEVTESGPEIKPADAPFGPSLHAWCQANKLAHTDDPASPMPQGTAYRLRLKGELKVALYRQGDAVLARAEGTLTLSDAADGTPLYLYTPVAVRRGGAQDKPLDVAKDALAQAAADALEQIGPRILAALPAAP